MYLFANLGAVPSLAEAVLDATDCKCYRGLLSNAELRSQQSNEEGLISNPDFWDWQLKEALFRG